MSDEAGDRKSAFGVAGAFMGVRGNAGFVGENTADFGNNAPGGGGGGGGGPIIN